MTFDRARLSAARLRAAETQPFLAQALYALTPIEDTSGSGTFSVDERLVLRVDPGALDRWTVPQCAGVLLHEVGHVVRDHAGRARTLGVGETTWRRWNVAADAEINDDLLADGVELPGAPVVPSGLGLPAGRAAELYYHALRDVPADGPDCGPGSHGVGGDVGEDGGGGRGADGSESRPGLSEAELLVLRRRVAEEVLRVAGGRQAGATRGGWARWAEALLEPKLDWRVLLQGYVRSAVAGEAGRVDYSYRRPSRRRMPRVVLPAMERPVPIVAVVIDVSASVTEDMLALAWTEVRACLRSIGVRRERLRVYATDVETVRVGEVGRRRVLITGGGGTDLRHGIATALGDRPRPGVVVVITDGWTPWPAAPPGVPLVVALVQAELDGDEQASPPPVPAWARVVLISDGPA